MKEIQCFLEQCTVPGIAKIDSGKVQKGGNDAKARTLLGGLPLPEEYGEDSEDDGDEGKASDMFQNLPSHTILAGSQARRETER